MAKAIDKLDNDELLDEFVELDRYISDDYSLVLPTETDFEHRDKLYYEILRRMNG